jgi:hypothetical protein
LVASPILCVTASTRYFRPCSPFTFRHCFHIFRLFFISQEYFLGSGPASSAYESSGAPGSGPGGLPSLPAGLNGGYYGALPGVPVQPAHSSAPVGLLGPGGPMSNLVGAPGIV